MTPAEIQAAFRNAQDFWFWKYEPQPGDTIVDIGAGRGEDVLPFAQSVGPTGRVVAIEAHPTTYDHLERLCRLYRLDNVLALNVAAMDSPGTVQIEDGDPWEANTARRDGHGLPVRATTLDAICDEHQLDHIDFLKMNIEGAEGPALLGMSNTLGKIQTICVSCHDFRADNGYGEDLRTSQFVTDRLTQSGFLVSRRSDPRAYIRDQVWGTRQKYGAHSLTL
jgi:FkbM family methyltransferase